MASKTNVIINGKAYYKLTKTIGRKLNAAGNEVPVKKTFYGDNKKEAEAKCQEFFDQQKQGIENKNQYFGIMAENWIYTFFVNDTHLSYNTKERYIAEWKNHIVPASVYSKPLAEVTAGTLQKLYNSLTCPPSAIRKINNLIRRFYKYLEQEGFARDFTSALTVPQKEHTGIEDEHQIVVWSNEEISTILNGFDRASKLFRLKFLLILAFNTGCRIGELLGIKYSDFNISDGSITIKRQIVAVKSLDKADTNSNKVLQEAPLKTKSSYRTIPLNESVQTALKEHKLWQKYDMLKNNYRTDYVFTTSSGSFYNQKNIRNACTRYYKTIGVPFKSIHTYRHTFATNLVKNGIDIQVASALLGHSDINMTAKYYVDVDFNEKKKAIQCLSNII